MEKTITIETLQQEVADLKTANEALKNENQDLTSRKDMWFQESQKWENKYKGLIEQVKSVGVIIGGMVA